MRESFEEIYGRYDDLCRKNIRSEQDLLNFEKINLIKERVSIISNRISFTVLRESLL